MTEEEIVRTFIKAHDPPYFEEIFRMTGSSFTAIINKLEEYDEFVKTGKIINVSSLKLQLDALQNQNSNGKKPPFKKKQGETTFIWDQGPSFRPRIRNHPTYSLKAAGKIGTVPPKLYPKGIPPGYDAQAICAYHSGSPYHTTGNCWVLKHKIQDMIDSGDILLRRNGEQGPNLSKNPLPEHGSTVGVIIADGDFIDPTQYIVDEIKVFGIMEADHVRMRKLSSVEKSMANDNVEKKLKSFVFEKEESCIAEGGVSKVDKSPFILDLPSFEWDISESVILEFPEQMPINNLQEVPWNYEESILLVGDKKCLKEEIYAITTSGRIMENSEIDVQSRARVKSPTPKPRVFENEAVDFLNMLKRSEYKIVDQLARRPTQISFLNLLLTSELHREALLKVLNEAQVPKDIPVDKFSNIVGNVLAVNHIAFSDDDLTTEGIGHNRALYISVRCNGKLLPRVLVDNGSVLNICPWNTLTKLGFLDIKLRPSATMVRGFDGSRRESMDETDLVLEIGPTQFQITCQVMDFSSVYNILLGRPWIHTSKSVLSSLHQMLRFIANDQLITVFAEDDCTMIIDAKFNGENKKRTPILSHHVADIVSMGWV
ncbi:uncharacterized protein LOC113768407 [Coffea eugenioides]|uniref:uncharacterized protein LOC113768407 n=1 Tax=Coffea eugenioides TaxID=49369 RepID=UPI000F6045A5|nr:uncharacterized protein LOC113768407 [Coffea eugenioides]